MRKLLLGTRGALPTILCAWLLVGALGCGGESVSAGPSDETDTGKVEPDTGEGEGEGECPAGVEACPGAGLSRGCDCGAGVQGQQPCEAVGELLCWGACNCPSVCTAGQSQACVCGDGQSGTQACLADGSGWAACQCGACPGAACLNGQQADPDFACGCFDVFRENVPCESPNASEAYGIRVFQGGSWRWATCQPRTCAQGFQLQGTSCVQCASSCPDGQELVGCTCQPADCPPDELICQCRENVCTTYQCNPAEFCANCEQANPDEYAANCVEPPQVELCETCHNAQHVGGTPGIEMPHVPFLKCTFCHLGNPDAQNPAEAHVARPAAMEDTWNRFDVNNPNGDYFNYLTHIGIEREEYDDPATTAQDFERGPGHEGLRWLMFVNPSDIRVVDYACGGGACHNSINNAVKQSLMRTAAGLLDGGRFSLGLARAVRNLPNTDEGARLATVSATTTGVTDPDFNPNDTPGTVETLAQYPVQDRSVGGVNEANLLEEALDKACGDCHIGGKGHNRRFGDFRSGGCAACHVLYADDGRSRTGDPRIPKDVPTYNQNTPGDHDAYSDIMLHAGERPHPFQHRLTRKMPATQCGHCHRESNWTVFQFKGLRVDPNKDLARTFGCQERGQAAVCRYDAQIYDPAAQKRRHGLSYHQIIDFEDLNGDGVDDTPADVHWLAGLECVDCHTPEEMHGDGSMKSRMDQAIKVRCESCHGTIDAYVNPDASPVANIVRQGGAFYLKSKVTGNLHYIYQVRDSVWPADNGPIDPRRGNPVYTANADYAHGRWNGIANVQDGTGIQFLDPSHPEAGETRNNFGHADTLECHACHSTWGNMCFGCHLTLADYDPDSRRALNYYSSISGTLTPGQVIQKDVTYMSTLDMMIGINSHGKVSQFTPGGKLFFRYLQPATGADYFLGETGAAYKTYRSRLGWGNRVYVQGEPAGLPPQEQGLNPNSDRRANSNAALAFNPVVPHTTQHKPRNCTSCHVPVGHEFDPDNDDYAAQAAATWGALPGGASAATSAYLTRIPNVVQRDSGATFSTSQGFLIPSVGNEDQAAEDVDIFTPGANARFAGATAGDTWAHRLDWVVLEDGFPLSSSSHTRIDGRNGLSRDPDRFGAGPLNGSILTKLRDRVRVYDMPGYDRKGNKLDAVVEPAE